MDKYTLCIDPGISGLGWFILKNTTPHDWDNIYGQGKTWQERAEDVVSRLATQIPRLNQIYCEWPYGVFSPDKNQSVLKLCYLIGKLDERIGPLKLVTVQSWKGSLPKAAVEHRVLKYFDLKIKIKAHAIDAAGIAMYLIQKGVIK